MIFKPFLVLHFYLIPWRIAAHHVKSTIIGKHFGKFHAPVEITVSNGRVCRFTAQRVRQMLCVRLIIRVVKVFDFLQSLIDGACIRYVESREFARFVHVALYVGGRELLVERVGVNIASQPQTFHTGRTHKVFPAVLFNDLLLQRIFGQGGNFTHFVGKSHLLAVDALHGEIAGKKRYIHALFLSVLYKLNIIQRFLVQGYHLLLHFFIIGRKSLFGHTIKQCVKVCYTHY